MSSWQKRFSSLLFFVVSYSFHLKILVLFLFIALQLGVLLFIKDGFLRRLQYIGETKFKTRDGRTIIGPEGVICERVMDPNSVVLGDLDQERHVVLLRDLDQERHVVKIHFSIDWLRLTFSLKRNNLVPLFHSHQTTTIHYATVRGPFIESLNHDHVHMISMYLSKKSCILEIFLLIN